VAIAVLGKIAEGLASGKLSPHAAESLSNVVAAFVITIEAVEFESRLIALEKAVSFLSAPRKLDRFRLEFSVPVVIGWEERKTMNASKFSDTQKAFILKQGGDGVPVVDICRKAGIGKRPILFGRRNTTACSHWRCGG
jgi:hypothetical protein